MSLLPLVLIVWQVAKKKQRDNAAMDEEQKLKAGKSTATNSQESPDDGPIDLLATEDDDVIF